MKQKIFTCFIFMAFSVWLFAEDFSAIIAISADGAETTYVLADIKRIDVKKKDTSVSMSVLLNDGTQEGSYRKLILKKEVTSIEELGEISLYVYPNPVSNTLSVMGVGEDASLSVYTLSGKSVIQEKGNQLDVTSLLKGTYILQINNQFVKFIKQ